LGKKNYEKVPHIQWVGKKRRQMLNKTKKNGGKRGGAIQKGFDKEREPVRSERKVKGKREPKGTNRCSGANE